MLIRYSLRILFLITVFCQSDTVSAQLGWWTWIKGPAGNDQNATWGTQGVPAIGNNPAAAYGPFYWQDSNLNFWAWGGGNRTGRGQADMWMYDIPTNMWTWKHGTNGLNSLATYGTQGVPAPGNVPAARQYGGASWIDNQNNLWLFGGNGWAPGNQNGEYAEMWKYNTTTNEWTWMHGPQGVGNPGSYGTQGVAAPTNYPPARREACAAWVDNNGIFWLFGGEANMAGPTQYYNDLWKYDPATNMWTWVRGSNTPNSNGNYGTMGVAAPTNDPPARSLYAHWKSLNGDLWFFGGGNDQNKSYNDMWKYNIATNQWTWVRGSNLPNPVVPVPAKCVASTSNDPAPRFENRACWTDSCGNFWMFGGVDFTKSPYWGVYNDLWFYHVQNNTWTLASVNGPAANGVMGTPGINNRPTHRFGAAPFKDSKGNLWIFAGRDTVFNNGTSYASHLSNIWRFFPDSICTRSTCKIVIANFNGTNLNFCAPDTVFFNNLSSNSTSWLWSFGDGTTSTLQHPTHVYTNPGTYTVMLTAYNLPDSSTFTQTSYVTVYANATAAFTPSNDTLCLGQSVTFANNSTNALTYNWNFGDGNTSTNTTPSHTYGTTGTFTVTLVSQNPGGCNDTTTQTIVVGGAQVTPGPNVVLTCLNNTAQISATSPTASVTYNWTGTGITSGGTTATPTVNQAGTYTVTVTDPASGCTNTATVTVTANTAQPNVTPGQNLVLTSCISSSGTINATSTTPGVTYSWAGAGIVSGGTTNSPTINAVGTYTVTVTDPSNGCTNTATVIVSSNVPLPNVLGGPSVTLSCEPNTSTINASSSTAGVTYNWNGPGIVSGGTSASPTINAAGTYTVVVTDPSTGCTNSATVVVNPPPAINATVSPNITISLGQGTTLTANGGITYNWYPSTGLNTASGNSVFASPVQTTMYCVIVTDARGCIDTACVTVAVEIPCSSTIDLKVPNAFSPNSDAVNDEFCLQGWDMCLKEFMVIIFDRWGEKVYESKDPGFCWNGTYLGKQMDAQVFVYHIKATYIDQKDPVVRKGNISLIR